jgi:hypothetical protein
MTNDYRRESKNENRIENVNSKKEENITQKDNKREENWKNNNNLFKKLTPTEFRRPLARNNTFKS